MRVFVVTPEHSDALTEVPEALPATGYLWLSFSRRGFEEAIPVLQRQLQRFAGAGLVDLHLSDLLNPQLPSHYEDTSWYDLLVFRRLAAVGGVQNGTRPAQAEEDTAAPALGPLPASTLDTQPVGFAVFDRVLVTVHPDDCLVREYFAQRLSQQSREADLRGSGRLPTSPAEQMLRMVNHMVDSYLELRRVLTRHFAALQTELLRPRSRFGAWHIILQSREALHRLEDISEDQRSAIQEWIDALDEWPDPGSPTAQRERELLRVRSKDLLEHIERVLTHVRRLEQSSEAAVQMHYSALGQRTNDIMRTLTVLTAIFLPLNLITGIFGMNFEALPLIHKQDGFWIAVGVMVATGLGLGGLFWRKRYLGTRPSLD